MTSFFSLLFLQARPSGTCSVALKAVNTKLPYINDELRSLSLYDCSVANIDVSTPLNFAEIHYSAVETISSLTSSHENKDFHISYSAIDNIHKMIVMEKLQVDHTRLGIIHSESLLFHSNVVLKKMSIKTIDTLGVQSLVGSDLTMEEVHIKTMANDAIVLTSGTSLYLTRTTIDVCIVPCFVLGSTENLFVTGNITVNGKSVDKTSFQQFVRFVHSNKRSYENSQLLLRLGSGNSYDQLLSGLQLLNVSNINNISNVTVNGNYTIADSIILEQVMKM